MFGSRVAFSGSTDPMAKILIFKNPKWWLAAILDKQTWPQLYNPM